MTKAVMLSSDEWKGLCLLNSQQLHVFLSGLQAPTAADLETIRSGAGRIAAFANAWAASMQPAEALPTNGAAPVVKKKRGRPRKNAIEPAGATH
jgi:hypothetical protein